MIGTILGVFMFLSKPTSMEAFMRFMMIIPVPLLAIGEVLKEHRLRCKMTQEFVAEYLGVSRQAVSKWERGESDPNMSNLMALAKLYGVSVEDILKQVN